MSKKRKKDGRPVQRKPATAAESEHPHGPEAKPERPFGHAAGRPTNPFVQQQQGRRGAQRGR